MPFPAVIIRFKTNPLHLNSRPMHCTYIYVIHSKNFDVDAKDSVYKVGCTLDINRRKFDSCYVTAMPYECKYVAYWELPDVDGFKIEAIIKNRLAPNKMPGRHKEIFRISKDDLLTLIDKILGELRVAHKKFTEDLIAVPPRMVSPSAAAEDVRQSEIAAEMSLDELEHEICGYETYEFRYAPLKVKCFGCKRMVKNSYVLHKRTGDETYGRECARKCINMAQLKRKHAVVGKMLDRGFTEDEVISYEVFSPWRFDTNPKLFDNHYSAPMEKLIHQDITFNNFISSIDDLDEKFNETLVPVSFHRAEAVAVYTFLLLKEYKMRYSHLKEGFSKSSSKFKKQYNLFDVFVHGIENGASEYFRLGENRLVTLIYYDGIIKRVRSALEAPHAGIEFDEARAANIGRGYRQDDFDVECRELLSSAAFKNLLKNKFTVITGGPGTGKTTLITFIAAYIQMTGLNVAICSPTASAADNLYSKMQLAASGFAQSGRVGVPNTCPAEPKTMHSLFKPPIDKVAVYFIDETSMLDVYTFNRFMCDKKETVSSYSSATLASCRRCAAYQCSKYWAAIRECIGSCARTNAFMRVVLTAERNSCGCLIRLTRERIYKLSALKLSTSVIQKNARTMKLA